MTAIARAGKFAVSHAAYKMSPLAVFRRKVRVKTGGDESTTKDNETDGRGEGEDAALYLYPAVQLPLVPRDGAHCSWPAKNTKCLPQ